MAHSVGEQAARAVKNSEKKTVETRTPEQILKVIRGNLAANLAVTPGDQRFLLARYEAAVLENESLRESLSRLQEKSMEQVQVEQI